MSVLVAETYPSGRTVKFDYNQDGDVASIWGTVGTQNRLYANGFSYNSSGAIERMRLGNGKWESYAYNNRLQITEIGLGNSATDKSLLKLEYGYGTATENNGNLRTQKISFNGLSQPFEQTYTYDNLNRLQSAEEKVNNSTTWKQTFQYDRFGNRRFDANNTTTLGSCSQAVCNPLINASDNRISSGQNYSYDVNGNLTRDANSKKFTYDAENHQIKVETVDAGGNPVSTNGEYAYDGEGKRVKKISASETVIFVYNGSGQLVAEYSTVLSQTPQVSYLTQDHLGSPRVITNQLGAVTTRKDYMAFGEETFSAQRTSALNYDNQSETRKGYTGYEKDDESGLDFAQARYYNSKHGRFTSVDPLTASANVKNPQTFNRYSYVLNSPYKFTDPLGLISENAGSPCGNRCQNSGGYVDGSAFSGTDTALKGIFEAMDLSRQVKQALDALESGAWEPGIGLTDTGGEKLAVGKALKNMLEKGSAVAQKIAAALINSRVTIDVTNGSQSVTDITCASCINGYIAAGEVSVAEALGAMTIYIAQREFKNSVSVEAAIEGNLIHEGAQALTMAEVIRSISIGGNYDKSRSDDERDAKLADINDKISRSGIYLQHGIAAGLIDKNTGKADMNVVNSAASAYNSSGTIRDFLKSRGIKW